MPKYVHYPRSLIRYHQLKGQVLRIPNVPSIAWLVMPEPVRWSKITLMTLPNGVRFQEHYSTIRRWIDEGQLEIVRTVGS